MELVHIHKPYLYSIKYDGEDSDEYNRLMEEWLDVYEVNNFLCDNITTFNEYWSDFFSNTLEAAEQIAEEANVMESYFEDVAYNTSVGEFPDYDSYFQYLDGVYSCEVRYIPMKGYGIYRPSLIRVYAIKIEPNVYVVVDGGIKLGKKIQNSPGLKEHVIKKINIARTYLSSLGITSAEDME